MKLIQPLPRSIIKLTICLFLYCLSTQAWSALRYCLKHDMFYETVYQYEACPHNAKEALSETTLDSSKKKLISQVNSLIKKAKKPLRLKSMPLDFSPEYIQEKIPINHLPFTGKISQGLCAARCYMNKTNPTGKSHKMEKMLHDLYLQLEKEQPELEDGAEDQCFNIGEHASSALAIVKKSLSSQNFGQIEIKTNEQPEDLSIEGLINEYQYSTNNTNIPAFSIIVMTIAHNEYALIPPTGYAIKTKKEKNAYTTINKGTAIQFVNKIALLLIEQTNASQQFAQSTSEDQDFSPISVNTLYIKDREESNSGADRVPESTDESEEDLNNTYHQEQEAATASILRTFPSRPTSRKKERKVSEPERDAKKKPVKPDYSALMHADQTIKNPSTNSKFTVDAAPSTEETLSFPDRPKNDDAKGSETTQQPDRTLSIYAVAEHVVEPAVSDNDESNKNLPCPSHRTFSNDSKEDKSPQESHHIESGSESGPLELIETNDRTKESGSDQFTTQPDYDDKKTPLANSTELFPRSVILPVLIVTQPSLDEDQNPAHDSPFDESTEQASGTDTTGQFTGVTPKTTKRQRNSRGGSNASDSSQMEQLQPTNSQTSTSNIGIPGVHASHEAEQSELLPPRNVMKEAIRRIISPVADHPVIFISACIAYTAYYFGYL